MSNRMQALHNKPPKIGNWKKTLARIWKYLDVHRSQLLLVLFTVLISSGLGLLGPYLIGRTIDEYIASDQGNILGMILIIIAAIYFLFLYQVFFKTIG